MQHRWIQVRLSARTAFRVRDTGKDSSRSSIGPCVCHALSDEPDFEDGIIRACAEAAGADFIISRDERAFARSPIKRLSAQEYIDLFVPTETERL